MRHLTDQPIDVSALVAEVMRDSDGAYVLFAGVVRNHHKGRAVESIDYEAYTPVAEKELARIAAAVESEFAGVRIGVVHRVGHLKVGDTAIAIVAASPHRAEAFAASREVIERVKKTVPIWKKEKGPDGETWVGWQE